MIIRTATTELRLLARQFKAIAIIGPRQSGKATLARNVFPTKNTFRLRIPMYGYLLHPLKGSLFENYVINDMVKERYNSNGPLDLYFWRDSTGNEMDVVIDQGSNLYPVESKPEKQ